VIAPRCAGFPCRRYPERGAAKLATLRSNRRRTFSRSGHRPHGALNGDLKGNCNGKSNCNGNCNRNRNRNCNRNRNT
jgi:hypothetical protein